MSVGAGGPDGGFGWLYDAAYSGVEKIIGAGAGSVGSAVLGETSDRRTRTDISVVTDSGKDRWGDRVGGWADRDGGGIFLTPLMLELNWAKTKTVSAVSAGFILLNAIAGLMGSWRSWVGVPGMTGGLLGVALLGGALLGGAIGSYWVGLAVVGCSDQTGLGGVVWGGECEIVVGMRVGCCWDENDALLRLAHPTLELGLGFRFPL